VHEWPCLAHVSDAQCAGHRRRTYYRGRMHLFDAGGIPVIEDDRPLHLFLIPVWTGGWKLGTHPCGKCGKTTHDWMTCPDFTCNHGHKRPFPCCCPHGADLNTCGISLLDQVAKAAII
jgi:hypothetical protein